MYEDEHCCCHCGIWFETDEPITYSGYRFCSLGCASAFGEARKQGLPFGSQRNSGKQSELLRIERDVKALERELAAVKQATRG